MKKNSVIIALSIILATSCSYFSNQNKENIPIQELESLSSDTIKEIRSLSPKPEHLRGAWVLTDYYDKILEDKTIAKYHGIPISNLAWGFYIGNDSLYSSGKLYGETVVLNEETDTLATLGFGNYIFKYDSISDKIIATGISEKNIMTYRRASEMPLCKILRIPVNKEYTESLSIGQLFIDSIIAGEYYSTDTNKKLMLNNNRTMSGYKNFNRYQIHDYSEGTLHPTYPYDVIFLEDSISEKGKLFNWKLKDKVLTLTEMETKTGGDSWSLGKKSITFIKRK